MELFSLDAKVKLDISEIESKLREAQSLLGGLDDVDISVGANVEDFETSMTGISDKLDEFDGRGVAADASLNTTDAEGNLETLETSISNYDDQTYTATAELTDNASGDIENIVTVAEGYDGDTYTATANLTDNATSGIESVELSAEEYDGETYTATADLTDNATSDIESVESSAEEYDGETYTATVDLTDNASSPLEDIKEEAEEVADAMGEDGLDGILSNFGAAFSVAAVVAGLGLVIDKAWEAAMATAQIGDTIDKQSQMMGMSASAYQQWQFVLSRNGADISVMRAINRNITTQFQPGNNDFTDNLNKLGIDYNTFKGWSSEEQAYNLVRSLTAARNSGKYSDIKFAQMAESLLGSRAYQQLMPLFNSGLDSFDELWGFAGENLMSDEAVKNSATLTDSITNLTSAWQGFRDTIMGEGFLPTLTGIVNAITSIVTDLRTAHDSKISLWGLLTGVDDGGLDRVAAVGEEYNQDLAMAEVNAQRANTLVSVLTDLETQMGPLAKDTDTWKEAMRELEGIYPGITAEIEKNNGSFLTGTQNIRDYISAQKDLAIVEAKQKALKNYSDAYTDELGRLYEYQAQEYAAKSEMIEIARALGYTGERKDSWGYEDFSLANSNQRYEGEYANFDPRYFYSWATTLAGNYSAGATNLTSDQQDWLRKITMSGLYGDWESATKNVTNQQEAVDAALKAYEDMAQLIETTVTSAMTGAGDGATALGTATANAAEKINNLSFQPKAYGYANGLWKVPYDNFDAQLHEGEAVLTRVEAERWRNGQGRSGGYVDAAATLNIGTYNSYGPSDEKMLVAALVSEQRNQLRAVGERV